MDAVSSFGTWPKAVMSVVRNVECPGYEFHVTTDGPNVFLRVVHARGTLDPYTSHPINCMIGRPWVIEFGAHPQQIVATAYAALQAFVEHEVRERFTYCGRHVMAAPRNMEQFWGTALMPEQMADVARGVPENRPIGDIASMRAGRRDDSPSPSPSSSG